MPRSTRTRLALAAYWLLPSLICLWLHRDGLHAWFQADDFAWLGANTEYNNARTFWEVLFRPSPQGTLRPWSERLFFFAFWHAFGWNALAYRVFIMANQCLNLVLVSHLVLRLSGSRVAAFAAPILWIANSALVTPMAWTCGYNEVLCTTFLLGALTVLTHAWGRRSFYFLQLAIFVLGFGALELNIVYPAIAATYAAFYNRRLLPWTLPMFAISGAYYKLHAALVPLQTSGPYQPHYDAALVSTLFAYWKLVFLPPYGFISEHATAAASLLVSASIGIAVFLFLETRNHRYAPAFFACWFVLTLAPLLPFRDHLTHYYLTIPLIGFASVGALALERWKIAGSVIVALYLSVQLPTLAVGERWYLERSRQSRGLVMGVKRVHEWEPGKTILLTDVSKDLYGFTVADMPFRLIRDARVYLAPEAEQRITDLAPNLAPVSRFVLSAAPIRHALADNELVVYSAAGTPLQEVTASYAALALASQSLELPRRIDPGSPLTAYLLGPEWYQLEGAYRWMPKRATLRMGGPRTASETLHVNGYAVPESLRMQPLALAVLVDGRFAGRAVIGPRDSSFEREFRLPPETIGKSAVTIALEVNRTFLADGHGRELGLVFGSFEIR